MTRSFEPIAIEEKDFCTSSVDGRKRCGVDQDGTSNRVGKEGGGGAGGSASNSSRRRNTARHCACTCCTQGEEDAGRSTKRKDKFKVDSRSSGFYRKMCLGSCFAVVNLVLAAVAVVVTYCMLRDLYTSMQNPVRSVYINETLNYAAPGLAFYPGGAKFLACGNYYNNVVTSKVRLGDLDLVNRNCSSTDIRYTDPHYPTVSRDAVIIRGPTSFQRREATFLHFELEDESRDFFTVSYFVFDDYDGFSDSTYQERVDRLVEYHRVVPTFALSSDLRMWIKLIKSKSTLLNGTIHTEFKVEYSVVDFWDRRNETEKKKHLFFIFFEWKNHIVEESRLIYTTTPWSIGGALCGVFLTIHRGFQCLSLTNTMNIPDASGI